ncbi:MAG: hypothetical protein ABEH38_02660 [Flavobacteriales bacterium]
MRTFFLMLPTLLFPILLNAQWQEKKKLCTPVSEKRWTDTGPIIGRFLDSLDYSKQNSGKQGRRRRLGELKKWLKAQACVKKVTIKEGTVKKRVPQKEILVIFDLNGHEEPMVIRIGLSKPYFFGGIYRKKR